MDKVVIKYLQSSAVTSSYCKFPAVYLWQNLWKLDDRQSYSNTVIEILKFFGPQCTITYYVDLQPSVKFGTLAVLQTTDTYMHKVIS